MMKKLGVLAAAALTALLVSGTFETADARQGSGGWSGGGGGGRGVSSGGGGSGRSLSGGGGGGRAFSGGRSFQGGGSVRSHRSEGVRVYGNRHVDRGRHHGRRHFRRGGVVAPYVGYETYGYSDGCYWLRQKALATDSSYWWNRYQACLDGSY
jgi:hypothetical protein